MTTKEVKDFWRMALGDNSEIATVAKRAIDSLERLNQPRTIYIVSEDGHPICTFEGEQSECLRSVIKTLQAAFTNRPELTQLTITKGNLT
jgi:hypothetical protein